VTLGRPRNAIATFGTDHYPIGQRAAAPAAAAAGFGAAATTPHLTSRRLDVFAFFNAPPPCHAFGKTAFAR